MNTDVVQFKKEAACNSKDDDEIIEIINEVSSSSVTNRPKPLMKAKIAKLNKLNEKIEHLELIQKSLLETLKSRTNENKILKQKTAKLIANVNELNQELESKSNEISDLKSKLVNQQRQNYKSKTDIINKISSIKVFETLKPNDKINNSSSSNNSVKQEQQQQSEPPAKPIFNGFRPKNNIVVKSIRKISLPIESNDKSNKTIAEIFEQQNNKPILVNNSDEKSNDSNQTANNIQKKKKNVVKITLNGLKNFNIDEIEDDDDDEERSFLIRELEMKKLKKLKK